MSDFEVVERPKPRAKTRLLKKSINAWVDQGRRLFCDIARCVG